MNTRCSAVALVLGWFARLGFGMYPSSSFPIRYEASVSGFRWVVIVMYRP